MSVKLGSTAINKLYLGATGINKAYLGSTLVLDTTGGGATDPNFASVVLLAPFNDGADGATAETDYSNSGHVLTFNGSAQISTAQSKFGTSSLSINGTAGRFVSAADHADWRLSAANSDEFFVEAWARPWSDGSGGHNGIVVGQWDAPGNQRSWALVQQGNLFAIWYSTAGTDFPAVVAGVGFTLNAWQHFAFSKDSVGKLRLFQFGTMVASATPANSAFHNSTAQLRIGRDYTAGREFRGNIEDVRITKGTDRGADDSGCPVPTAAHPRS